MQSTRGYTLAVLFAASVWINVGAMPAHAEQPSIPQLVLRQSAESTGALVRLGDLVQIVGGASAQDESGLDEDTAELVLFPAPSRNTSRTISRRELVELLTLCDLSPRKVHIIGADEVTIHPAAAELRHVVRPALHLIPDSSHLRTEPVSPAAVRAARTAAVEPSDQPEERPSLVRRNGAVTVHCLAAGVKVTTSGKSLADAAQGEQVLVELADSREKVLAQVLGPQVVQIQVAAK
jgi:hypothetical protein